MTTTQAIRTTRADRFGRRVAARLSAGAEELPYEVAERLRASRTRAVAARKRVQPRLVPKAAPQLAVAGGTASLGFDDDGLGLWGRIASALPIVVLACGLVFIHVVQQERRASELAEVDEALLTDDLPPAAYADPGFLQFLKSAQGGPAAPR
jgi:hypothetical protein